MIPTKGVIALQDTQKWIKENKASKTEVWEWNGKQDKRDNWKLPEISFF